MIKELLVRGAPLIGATAAYSLYLASKQNEDFAFIQNKVNQNCKTYCGKSFMGSNRVLRNLDKNNIKAQY